MCRSDGLDDHLLSLPVDDKASSTPKRRIRLWEITDQIHCSIIGTCASAADLQKLARRLKIRIADGAIDYDIHGYFVKESTFDTPFTRAFHKLMDDRYEGAVRRVARAKDSSTLGALWADMRDRGQIAPAYWAFMTHTHIPSEMRNLIFGEVHMLSHLAGSSYRRKSAETVILKDQLQDVTERSHRVESGLREAVESRDLEIDRLRTEVTQLKANLAKSPASNSSDGDPVRRRKVSNRMDKIERALVSARVRARHAETREKSLEEKLHTLELQRQHLQTAPIRSLSDDGAAVASLNGKVVLYVGGRNSTVDRLRSVAAEYDAELRHHDGGLEQTPQRLDRLLPSVDCVLCPIDCVSHDACLRAKKACQKLAKPFVPLRSASLTSFRTALERLATQTVPGSNETH